MWKKNEAGLPGAEKSDTIFNLFALLLMHTLKYFS